ncbi:MAG: hypothetical protein CVU48_04005 [Candidatus Cloacimonetes bacterium HGW-Cloacimonetes-1]|nr:MAG: hypothetical protein CVU48_04005 [Candidatus Cloacimonetes bacterium HGW-Cloacimonetes-1]
MNSKNVIYSIITAIIIVSLYHIFEVGRFSYPEFRLKSGQVADFEVIAPFDFQILKPEAQIIKEQEKSVSNLSKPYTASDEVLFESSRVIDDVFLILNKYNSATEIETALKTKAVNVSVSMITPLLSESVRDKAYTKFSKVITDIYKHGVYESISADSLMLYQDNSLNKVNIDVFESIESAKENYTKAFEDIPYREFAMQLMEVLIKPNIQVNNEKMKELSDQVINTLPVTEGQVLQNEVIVRKNARLTDTDIIKLHSLQEAYKTKNIRKSPFEQLLLTLGLLIFFLIIIIAVNYYYYLQVVNDSFKSGSIPLNVGFILLVCLAIVNNFMLGYNNILIPFALTTITAAVLIGLEFGIFYCIGSVLIVSPFINWETYTPVVYLLSTVLTLVMLEKHKAYHEFFSIWFYLTITSIVVSVPISIYKNDPLLLIFKSIGFVTISSTISVMGIMLLVPYFDRKWHRATKQNLLELLDFNHPLLKKLATDAVGTYHHSLIVGNLSERAAEAIGANPLLARVGSYYHDIGKIVNTEAFTENNEDSSDIHNLKTPQESAQLIKGHVLEGIELSKKYKIPKPVIDIIKQHHGTSYIRYFLDLAAKKQESFDPYDFRYPGPKPQTKEAVLVMLADIVESTTKAKTIATEKDIVKIIDDTILRLIKEGQLDDAPITFNDLTIVKYSMIPVLESIYRKRLDYPEAKDSE